MLRPRNFRPDHCYLVRTYPYPRADVSVLHVRVTRAQTLQWKDAHGSVFLVEVTRAETLQWKGSDMTRVYALS